MCSSGVMEKQMVTISWQGENSALQALFNLYPLMHTVSFLGHFNWPHFCPQSDSEVNILNILCKSRHQMLLTLKPST